MLYQVLDILNTPLIVLNSLSEATLLDAYLLRDFKIYLEP